MFWKKKQKNNRLSSKKKRVYLRGSKKCKLWHDLLQGVLSIKTGKIFPSTLLRKLSNYSRKKRLYRAYRELGIIVITVFLLKHISDIKLREQIGASTNKVEAYNSFSRWLFFGFDGIISENDLEDQEKRIKYYDLVANAVIFQNVYDITLDDLEMFHNQSREIFLYSIKIVKSKKGYRWELIPYYDPFYIYIGRTPKASWPYHYNTYVRKSFINFVSSI